MAGGGGETSKRNSKEETHRLAVYATQVGLLSGSLQLAHTHQDVVPSFPVQRELCRELGKTRKTFAHGALWRGTQHKVQPCLPKL